MSEPLPTDWGKYNERIQSLERKLEAFLEGNEAVRTDDRRLAKVYLAFAKLISARLNPDLRYYLKFAEVYSNTGIFPPELQGVSLELGKIASTLQKQDASLGRQTDQPFIYELIESCTRHRFGLNLMTDLEPIGWMAAIGVPVEDIEAAVYGAYPQIGK